MKYYTQQEVLEMAINIYHSLKSENQLGDIIFTTNELAEFGYLLDQCNSWINIKNPSKKVMDCKNELESRIQELKDAESQYEKLRNMKMTNEEEYKEDD